MSVVSRGPWHCERPAVYLDHWVWVSMACAAKGRPEQPVHSRVLYACRQAAADGVAFPLSSTHYCELQRTKDPRQRYAVADVMASISFCRTLRHRRDLVKHQMKTVFHEQVGRPTFRPAPQKVLGRGVGWAMAGAELPLVVSGPGGFLTDADVPRLSSWLRLASQYGEYCFLAGPKGEDHDEFRSRRYRPGVAEASSQSRVDFEKHQVTSLEAEPVSARELRVYLVCSELVHEYLNPLNEVCAEYGISLGRHLGSDTNEPGAARAKMMAFAESVPILRVADDLKFGLFRDRNRTRTLSFLPMSTRSPSRRPYCRIVVPDADTASRARQTKAADALGTVVTASLEELLDLSARPRCGGSGLESGPDRLGRRWAGHRVQHEDAAAVCSRSVW